MENVNLERRFKRHVWAPSWDMFAVCLPGLEEMLSSELTALGLTDTAPEPGGVSFRGKLGDAYLVNLQSRLCGRVLLRLKDFRVRRFADLTRQVASIPWEAFLAPNAPLKIQVTLKESNLGHAGVTADETMGQISKRLEGMGLLPPRPAEEAETNRQMVMIRGVDRRASISLDTSGDHLHKRGYRLASGKAPLREDIAAALLILAGYQPEQCLVDPMCGAGTLGIEAALMARGMAPGSKRTLAMEQWPAHRTATWEHMCAKALEQALPKVPKPVFSSDRLAGALRLAGKNAERAQVAQDINFRKEDFFDLKPPKGQAPGLVVINPPYGKRLGSVRQAKDFAARLAARLNDKWQGWSMGVVLYRPEWAQFFSLEQPRTVVVPHGGITVTLLAGKLTGKPRII